METYFPLNYGLFLETCRILVKIRILKAVYPPAKFLPIRRRLQNSKNLESAQSPFKR